MKRRSIFKRSFRENKEIELIDMMETQEIQKILIKNFPEAEVTVQDLTGTKDHFQVHVIWQGFVGQGLIDQHQAVNRALSDCLEDGRIHALSIKTYALKTK